jgi:CheY-like chemotaxis protein
VNARDAMPAGGRLTIATRDAERGEAPGASPGARTVALSVRDTGAGIDAATQERLFEPFFTTKEVGKGTGLGLATVYGIVTQSGGQVAVSSQPGEGTVFTVYLPGADDSTLPAATAADPPPAAGGTETILLVEDERDVRELARDLLEAGGYTVLEAAGPGAALLLAAKRAGALHLLLTDVVMPHMSGRELAERVLAARPDVRVLYMSGYTDDAIGRHGILDSDTAFLQKPFTAAALARKVREVLDGPAG